MTTPEFPDESRRGDEPPETKVRGFDAYGGSVEDRKRLATDDPELIETEETVVDDLLGKYQDTTGLDEI